MAGSRKFLLPLWMWGGGLVFLGLLAIFCSLVLGPYMQVRSVVTNLKLDADEQQARAAVARLGGPQAAARKLALYIRLPERLVPWERRDEAIGLLGLCGAHGVRPLALSLRDQDSSVRSRAAWGLGSTESSQAVPFLNEALGDADPHVRRAAAGALWSCGDSRAVRPLEIALDDEDRYVRREAAMSLWKIAGRAERLVPMLMEDLRLVSEGAAEDGMRMLIAINMLGKVGNPARVAAPELVLIADSPTPFSSRHDAERLKDFPVRQRGEMDNLIRSAASEALAKMRVEEPSK